MNPTEQSTPAAQERHTLDPFTQGYVEALFAAPYQFRDASDGHGSLTDLGFTFSDLAPETLARIMGDCAAFLAQTKWPSNAYNGGQFWQARAIGRYSVFPPLTPYLADDGKICLKERDQ